ncbi:MAG: class I SAM-dependent methyltransferase [Anaerolineales bacterium]|nr:class I SAM-dependent methyltransferase [Anaerolineales bacterium]
MFYWIVGILVSAVALYFLYREVYFYEATHLGTRIQSWLYDGWAAKYDMDKQESQARDAEMLACPILDFIVNVHTPLILDIATGTGRLPLALLCEPEFKGHVVAVDVSTGMLNEAAQKLSAYHGRFMLVHKLNYPLPFPDGTFDVVSCLEALEVMPEMETPLAELCRVLRPGGMLISSRGTDASGRSAKVRSVEVFKTVLQGMGFEQVDIIPWWRWFDRVTARKPGEFSPAAGRSISDVLVCKNCRTTHFEIVPGAGLKCVKCGNKIPQNAEGVLLL